MSLSDMFLNFAINLVAGVVGILIVLWIERQRRPKLSFKIGQTGKMPADDPLKRDEAVWLHIEVHNRRIPRWLSWVYDGEPALNTRAWITFHHLDGHKVFDREMAARWPETPEPILQVFDTDKGKVARIINEQNTIDIPTGEFADLDIAIRMKEEEACYGWNNQSYLSNWRNPSWKLDKGRYMIRIRVKTVGREFIDSFMLVNDTPISDFRLENLKNDMKKKLR